MRTKSIKSRYDQADLDKVEVMMTELVKSTLNSGKTTAFYNALDLFREQKFSRLTHKQFDEQLGEVLAGSEFHKNYGDWITCEYECNIRVLVQLAAAGDKQSINDADRNHFINTETRDARKKPVRRLQNMSIAVPADMDPNVAVQLAQAAFNAK